MKVISFASLIILVCIQYSFAIKKSPNTTNNGAFSLTCDVIGFSDSTWFILENTATKTKDSVLSIKGHFKFTNKTTEPVKTERYVLRTKNSSDYKFFWVENSEMTFKAVKGKFRQASVTGSIAQSDDDRYTEILKPFERKADSISEFLMAKEIPVARKNELKKEFALAYESKINKSFEFIRNNPASIVSVNILDIYSTTWGKKTVNELYNVLSEENKRSAFGKNVAKYIALNKDIKIGDKFVDIEQLNSKGEKIKLSNVKGKLVLLEFWAAWCGPCRESNPGLIATYNEYKEKGFEILGVSLDDSRNMWIKAIEKDGLPWENISELKGDKNSAAIIYGVYAIPDNFLIDETGTIIARGLRGEKLDRKLSELLLK